METGRNRDPKARLSHRDPEVATTSPVNANASTDWAWAMVREGRAHWNGGKPAGSRPRVRLEGGASVSDAVIEARGW